MIAALLEEGALPISPAQLVTLILGLLFIGYVLRELWKLHAWFTGQIKVQVKTLEESTEKRVVELRSTSDRQIGDLRAQADDRVKQLDREHEVAVKLMRNELEMDAFKAKATFDTQVATLKAQTDALEKAAATAGRHQEEIIEARLREMRVRQSGFERLYGERASNMPSFGGVDAKAIAPASQRPGPPVDDAAEPDTSPGLPPPPRR